jgi:YHS domain-containing protein
VKKVSALPLLLIVLSAVLTNYAFAANKSLLNLDRNGIAIQGYDPVAFLTQHRPVQGKAEFASTYNGARYQFASSEDKTAFDKNPAMYEPQFGGYCAYGASRGKTAPIKIEAFQIVNGRLLMQYDTDIRDEFNKDQAGNLKLADQKWPGLVDKLGK